MARGIDRGSWAESPMRSVSETACSAPSERNSVGARRRSCAVQVDQPCQRQLQRGHLGYNRLHAQSTLVLVYQPGNRRQGCGRVVAWVMLRSGRGIPDQLTSSNFALPVLRTLTAPCHA